MSSTPAILAIVPAIIRIYALSFLLLPFNIFSAYYFQAILQPVASFIVSVARGLVISGFLILLLPILFHAGSLWLAMPVTEFLAAIYVTIQMKRATEAFPEKDEEDLDRKLKAMEG